MKSAVLYLPYLQQASMMLVVRAAGDPVALAPALRAAVQSIDKDQPLHDVQTMDERMAAAVADSRSRAALLIGFATLALALAALGIYGVVSYGVAQRTREFGIRAALGADRGAIMRLAIGRGLALTALGIAAGTAGALAAAQLLSGFLFQVSATDPATFVAVAALLAMTSLLACFVPARRAMRADPLSALRAE